MTRIRIQRIRRTPPRDENTAMRMRGVSEPECKRNSLLENFSLMQIFNSTEIFEKMM